MPPTHARIHRAGPMCQLSHNGPLSYCKYAPARTHVGCFSAGPKFTLWRWRSKLWIKQRAPPPPLVRARCNNVLKPHYERIMQLLNFIPSPLSVDEIASPVAPLAHRCVCGNPLRTLPPKRVALTQAKGEFHYRAGAKIQAISLAQPSELHFDNCTHFYLAQ